MLNEMCLRVATVSIGQETDGRKMLNNNFDCQLLKMWCELLESAWISIKRQSMVVCANHSHERLLTILLLFRLEVNFIERGTENHYNGFYCSRSTCKFCMYLTKIERKIVSLLQRKKNEENCCWLQCRCVAWRGIMRSTSSRALEIAFLWICNETLE